MAKTKRQNQKKPLLRKPIRIRKITRQKQKQREAIKLTSLQKKNRIFMLCYFMLNGVLIVNI